MIEYLSIDLETKSGTDLSKSGVYRYTEDPEFEILLFGYSVNGGEVSVIDVACGEQIPEEVLRAIVDESVTKWAFNAAFERICLSAWLRKNRPDLFCSYSIPEDSVGNYLNPASWKCSLIWSAYIGLPLSLEGVGAVLKLQDQKMTEGKALIKYFSVPCKPTKVNGGRFRIPSGKNITCPSRSTTEASAWIGRWSSRPSSWMPNPAMSFPLKCRS